MQALRRAWIPTSRRDIAATQAKLLLHFVRTPLEPVQVDVGEGSTLNFVATPIQEGSTNLVVMHGLGSGLGFFFRNYDGLACGQGSGTRLNVVAGDWLGMGGSSRPSQHRPHVSAFRRCNSAKDPVDFFVDSLHTALCALGLKKFVLLGHSLGGFLCARYAMKHPDALQGLVLASPAGLPEHPVLQERIPAGELSFARRLLDLAWSANLTPQQLVRTLGPRGYPLVESIVRARFGNRWDDLETKLIADYLYHITCAPGSGEYAMNSILQPVFARNGTGVYAREPLAGRLYTLPDVPLLLMFGDDDWLWHPSVDSLCARMKADGRRVQLARLPAAGHHLYLDNYADFNRITHNFAVQCGAL